jgi:predicted transcriptional regulator YheO
MSKKLTPKYWVLWDNQIGDILIKTLDKSLQGARNNAYHQLGNKVVHELEDDGVFEFKLISIEEV